MHQCKCVKVVELLLLSKWDCLVGFNIFTNASKQVLVRPILQQFSNYAKILMYVLYFDQRLGGAHSKPWSKSSFLTVLCKKSKKMHESKKFVSIFSKKKCFLSLHQNACKRFYSQKKKCFHLFYGEKGFLY